MVVSIPFGVLCAENMVPFWVYQPVRRLMDAARAINEMVFAMLLVAVGLGPFAGVLALFVHITGTLARLFAEAIRPSIQDLLRKSGQKGPTWWRKSSMGWFHRSSSVGLVFPV